MLRNIYSSYSINYFILYYCDIIIYLRFEGKLVKVDSSDNDRKGNEGKVFQNISYDYSVLLHNELVFEKFRIYELVDFII